MDYIDAAAEYLAKTQVLVNYALRHARDPVAARIMRADMVRLRDEVLEDQRADPMDVRLRVISMFDKAIEACNRTLAG